MYFGRPVIGQNLYNILSAITLLTAWVLRLEKVNFRSICSHGKVIGTLTKVTGAMVMTLVKGPVLELFWTKGSINQRAAAKNGTDLHDSIRLKVAITLETYPADLSLTVWICLVGTLEGTIAALIMEKGNAAIWAIKWDTKLLTAAHSERVVANCLPIRTGNLVPLVLAISDRNNNLSLSYYIQGMIMKHRGPVFGTAFSPLCMVIVAIMSTFNTGIISTTVKTEGTGN
ncbi:hypothetical protein V6N12_030671 [Hibiscus sabdariffa]|uniref:WAT1-related protein n=1 Tax=Hibiscus sabdariffa TaxID=183260 RepID=A0ABR2E6N3_9ROSI